MRLLSAASCGLPSFLYASSIMANDASTCGPQMPAYGVGDSVREPAYGASALQNCRVGNSSWPMAACLLQRKNVLYVDLFCRKYKKTLL